jgi:hypothetical protein
LARPLNLGSSQLGQQLRNIRGERLSSDSLAGFRGKSAPHPRGERGSEPRARASEARAQRPGSCSPTPFTHRRRGLASTAGNGSGCRDTKQVLQIPGRTVFTPCGAVSRRGVGPGTREERGERREGAGERERGHFEAHTDSRDRTFSEALGRSNRPRGGHSARVLVCAGGDQGWERCSRRIVGVALASTREPLAGVTCCAGGLVDGDRSRRF